MSLKKATDLERDRRLIERNLRTGELAPKLLDEYLATLPDVAAKGEEIDEVRLLAEAKECTAQRREQMELDEAERLAAAEGEGEGEGEEDG